MFAFFGLSCIFLDTAAQADSAEPQTFSITTGGGYTVYKSKMVQSNDTSTTVNYGFAVYGGDRKNIGMLFQREQGTYAFELNSASIQTMIQDVHLRYRYGPVYAGLVFNESQFTIKAPPDADGDGFLDQDTAAQEYMKVINTGTGFNLGANFAVGKSSAVYLDITSVTTSLVNQSYIENDDTTANGYTEKEITFGPRMDIDIGGSIALTKNWLDLNFGFKQRAMTISVDGESYKEQLNITYLGFKAGWDF